MARKRYSQLTAASSVESADIIAISQGGVSKRATKAQLLDGVTGSASVADDIGKSGATNIDRVLGIKGVTLKVTDTLATGEVWMKIAGDANLRAGKPVPRGWYDVMDYGATGDGVTDDGPAIRTALAAIVASGTVLVSGYGGGNLHFPPGTYAVKSVDTSSPDYLFHQAGLSIDAYVTITGASSGGGGAAVIFDPGMSGFVFEFPNAQGSTIENLSIQSTVSRETPRANTTAYVVGDKVSLTGENRYYFECVTSGTSGDAAAALAAFSTPELSGGYHLNSLEAAITDGTAAWRPRIAAGYVCKTIVFANAFHIHGFTNSGIHCQAGTDEWATTSLTDSASFRNGYINNCGVGAWMRGNDSNNMLFDTIIVQTPGTGQAIGSEAGVGIWNHSGLGSSLLNVYVNSGTGRGIIVDAAAGIGSTVVGCATETSFTNRIKAPAIVIGGNMSPGYTSDSDATIIHANGCQRLYEVDGRSGYNNATSYLGRVNDGPNETVFAFTNDLEGPVGYRGVFGWRYGILAAGSWAFGLVSGQDQVPLTAFSVTGHEARVTKGRGWLGVERGVFVGKSTDTAKFFDGPIDRLTDNHLRTGQRLQGDRFRLTTSATDGRWASKIVTSAGYRGIPWTASLVTLQDDTFYGQPATVIEPTTNGANPAAGLQVWLCTTQGTTHATTEPVWPGSPTPGVTTIADGTVVWTYLGTTPGMAYVEMVESASVDHVPQTSAKWKDSSDTGTTSSKTAVVARRRQAQTTTAAASQVLDDGGTYAGEDFTLANNAITRVTVELFVKKSGTAAGGTIDIEGTYYRDAGGNATLIGTATPVYNLTGSTLDGTTAALVVSSGKVEVQVSPESADTLDWGVFRTQTTGGAAAAL